MGGLGLAVYDLTRDLRKALTVYFVWHYISSAPLTVTLIQSCIPIHKTKYIYNTNPAVTNPIIYITWRQCDVALWQNRLQTVSKHFLHVALGVSLFPSKPQQTRVMIIVILHKVLDYRSCTVRSWHHAVYGWVAWSWPYTTHSRTRHPWAQLTCIMSDTYIRIQ